MKRFLLSFLILTAGVLHAQYALGTLLGPPDDDFSAKTKVDLLVELAEVKPGTIVVLGLVVSWGWGRHPGILSRISQHGL